MPLTPVNVRGTELLAGDSREQYRQKIARITLDSMVQFVGLLDVRGTVLEINQVALDAVGINLSDVEGKPFWTTFWWQVSDEINATLRESIRRAAGGEFVRWDTEIFGRAGGKETIIIDASLCPVKDEHGNVVFIAAEGRDITEKKAYEREIARQREELAQLDVLKTRFFSNVSHEFRTPLALMLGPLEDTLSGPLPAAEREQLEVTHRNALRLLKLVNTLLDFSRIEAGRVQSSYEPVDLAAFTTELASVFRSTVERAGLQFTVDCPALDEPVFVDREMWEKIVLNLVSNAFKFTFAGGIEVRLRREDGHALMLIRDTGTGIPAAELPRVFERFHRVKGARGRTYEGTGIGLALVQELVRLHGGTVQVESEVDRGSIFAVRIPLGKAHLPAERIGAPRTLASTGTDGSAWVEEAERWLPEPKEVSRSPGSAAARDVRETGESGITRKRRRILLADDNADMRDYVRRLLSAKFDVVAVNDGVAALQAVREDAFDLVLTDVMMPRLDGFGLLKELRADECFTTIPVIMLSARAGEESRVEGIEAGADDYLIKPFSARELLARVGTHLELSRTRRENEAALHSSQQQLQLIIDSVPALISYVNPQRRYRMCNRSYTEWFGLSCDEVLGKPMREILGEDAWHAIEPHVDAALAGETREFETEANYRLGGRRWIHAVYTPHRDAQGRVAGIVILVTDVTARKQVDEKLRKSEERYRSLFESIDEGFCVIEVLFENNQPVDYRFVEVNPAFEKQSGMRGATGKRMLEFVSHIEPHWLENYGRVALTGEPIRFADEYKSLQSWFDVYAFRVGDPYQRRVAVLFNNITGRMKSEEALREAHRLLADRAGHLEEVVTERTAALREIIGDLEAFSYSMAHDLRGPLRAMQGYANILKQDHGAQLDETGTLYLTRIATAAERMHRLVSDVLTYSRVTREPLALERVALQPLLRDIIEQYPALKTARITVAEPLPDVSGNQAALTQLFSNLLTNAVKFVLPGSAPVVELSGRNEGGDVAIRIKDNGIGIASEDHERIFRMFERVHDTTEYEGTGIGLAIARRAAERMHGTISVHSEPGCGSSFTVRLRRPD